jgi:hypothetical protein
MNNYTHTPFFGTSSNLSSEEASQVRLVTDMIKQTVFPQRSSKTPLPESPGDFYRALQVLHSKTYEDPKLYSTIDRAIAARQLILAVVVLNMVYFMPLAFTLLPFFAFFMLLPDEQVVVDIFDRKVLPVYSRSDLIKVPRELLPPQKAGDFFRNTALGAYLTMRAVSLGLCLLIWFASLFFPFFQAAWILGVPALTLSFHSLKEFLPGLIKRKFASWFVLDPEAEGYPVAWQYIALIALKGVMLHALWNSPFAISGIAAFIADIIREFGLASGAKKPLVAAADELKKLHTSGFPGGHTERSPFDLPTAEKAVFTKFDFSIVLTGIAIMLAGAFKISDSKMLNYSPPHSLKDLASQVRDFATLRDQAWPLMVGLINSMYEHISGTQDPFIPSKYGDVERRYSILIPEINHYKTSNTVYKPEDITRLSSLVSTLLSLSDECRKNCFPLQLTNAVNASCNSMLSKEVLAKQAAPCTNHAMPIGILMMGVQGAGGVGKTELWRYIVASFAKRTGLSPACAALKAIEKFHDSYRREDFIELNDILFGMEGNPEHVTECSFVKFLIDTAFYACNYSAVENKATVGFEPKVVYVSTNQPNIFSLSQYVRKGGVEWSAFQRRFPFVLRLTRARVGVASPDNTMEAFDEFYSDLEMLDEKKSTHHDKWVPIKLSQLLENLVCMYEQQQLSFARPVVPLDFVARRNNFSCTLTGTRYDPFRFLPFPGAERTVKVVNGKVNVREALIETGLYHPSLVASFFFGNEISTIEIYEEALKAIRPRNHNGRLSLDVSHMSHEDYLRHLTAHHKDAHYRYSWRFWSESIRSTIANMYQPAEIISKDSALDFYVRENLSRGTLPAHFFDSAKLEISANMSDFTAPITASDLVDYHNDELATWVSKGRTVLINFVREHPVMSSVLAVVGALSIGSGLYMLFMNNIPIAEPASGKTDAKVQRPAHRRRKRVFRTVSSKEPEKAMSVAVAETLFKPDPNAADQLASVLQHNCVELALVGPEPTRVLQGLFIGGHRLITVGHFLEKGKKVMPDGTVVPEYISKDDYHKYTLYMYAYGRDIDFAPIPLDLCETIRLEEPIDLLPSGPVFSDTVAIIVPNNSHKFPFILDKIAHLDDAPYTEMSEAIVGRWITKPDDELEIHTDSTQFLRMDSRHAIKTTDGITYGGLFAVKATVNLGSCGSPIFAVNPHLKRRLMGIIASRSGNVTYGTLIPEELLGIDKENTEGPTLPEADLASLIGPREIISRGNIIPLPSGFALHTSNPRKHAHSFLHRIIDLKKSPFHTYKCEKHKVEAMCNIARCPNSTGKWCPPQTFPYNTAAGVFDPIWAAAFKVPYEPLAITYLGQHYWHSYILPQMRELYRYVIPPPLSFLNAYASVSEALNGVVRPDGARLLEKLEWQTAPGLPWTHLPGVLDPPHPDNTLRGKARFIKCSIHGNLGVCAHYQCDAARVWIPEVQDRLTKLHIFLDQFYFQIFIKSECREPNKLPRLVSVCPMDLSSDERQTFQTIFSGMLPKCDDVNYISCVGTNVHSLAYHKISEYRRQFGKFGIHCDASSSDYRQKCPTQEAAMALVQQAIEAYFSFDSKEEKQRFMAKVRQQFYKVSGFSRSMAGHVFSTVDDFTTGCAVTIFLNTIFYACLIYGTWAYLQAKAGKPHNASDYMTLVFKKIYGDDWYFSHNDPDLTVTSMIEAAKAVYGCVLTNPTEVGKTSKVGDYVPVSDLEMLKRTDVLHPDGHYHGRLGRTSIDRPLTYVNDNTLNGTRQVMNSVLLEYYENGDEAEFNKMHQKFAQYLIDAQAPSDLPSWHSFQRSWETAKSPISYSQLELEIAERCVDLGAEQALIDFVTENLWIMDFSYCTPFQLAMADANLRRASVRDDVEEYATICFNMLECNLENARERGEHLNVGVDEILDVFTQYMLQKAVVDEHLSVRTEAQLIAAMTRKQPALPSAEKCMATADDEEEFPDTLAQHQTTIGPGLFVPTVKKPRTESERLHSRNKRKRRKARKRDLETQSNEEYHKQPHPPSDRATWLYHQHPDGETISFLKSLGFSDEACMQMLNTNFYRPESGAYTVSFQYDFKPTPAPPRADDQDYVPHLHHPDLKSDEILGGCLEDLPWAERCSEALMSPTETTQVESVAVETAPLTSESLTTPEIVIQKPTSYRAITEAVLNQALTVAPDITDRWVRIIATTFTTAGAPGTSITALLLPDTVISNSTFLQARIAGHQFLRCDCEVEIRLNPPPFSRGSFFVCVNPGLPRVAAVQNVTVYQWSHTAVAYVSLDSATNTRITVPWASPYQWYTTALGSAASQQCACGQLDLVYVCPMDSTGANVPTSVPIEVWARLKNVVLAAPNPLVSFTLQTSQREQLVENFREYIRPRVLPELPVAERCSSTPNISPQQEESFKQMERDQTAREQDITNKMQRKRGNAGRASKYADLPPTTVQLPKPSAEAAGKQRSILAPPIPNNLGGQIVYGITEFFKTVGSTLTGIVGSLAPQAGTILRGLAMLDKPLQEVAVSPTYTRPPPEHYTRGLDVAQTLGTFQGEYTDPIVASQPHLLSLCKIPAMIASISFSSASAVGTVIWTQALSPGAFCFNTRAGAGPFTYTRQETNMSEAALRYLFWTGSFNILIKLECAATVSGRLGMIQTPPGVVMPANCMTNTGQYPMRFWEFRGPTIIKVNVVGINERFLMRCLPLVSSAVGASTISTLTGGNIGIFPLQSPITYDTTGSTSVCMIIWGAAGPDFKFYRYLGQRNLHNTDTVDIPASALTDSDLLSVSQQIQQADLPVAERCVDIAALFQGDFPKLDESYRQGFTSNYFAPDEEDNMVGCMRRPEYISTFTGIVIVNRAQCLNPFTELTHAYLYWRGSFRLRAVSSQTGVRMYADVGYGWVQNIQANYSSGRIVSHPALTADMSYEWPWYSSLAFQPFDTSAIAALAEYVTLSADNYSTAGDILGSVGEDFGLLGYCGPPQRIIVNAALANKSEWSFYHSSGLNVLLDRRAEVSAEMRKRGLLSSKKQIMSPSISLPTRSMESQLMDPRLQVPDGHSLFK